MKHLNTTLINFQKITDPRGNLTVAQSFKDVPFAIERAYWYMMCLVGNVEEGIRINRAKR